VYPGAFDPITAGHLDIIKRAVKLVDRLYIAVASESFSKSFLFSDKERLEMIRLELKNNHLESKNIEVEIFSGLMVDFAKSKSATIAVRGIRTLSDFEYEYQMAQTNSMLNNEIETIFLPASTELQLVSSKFVKEIMRFGGDPKKFLSNDIKRKMQEKYRL
ncbi:MAG: pantetheine-phosphate adenylyltransferase, partial [Pseudomonadota bacterium]